jgi:hypothetical protein
MAPAAASDAEKNRKLIENVVVWPGRNDTGWINMLVTIKGELPGHVKDIGWPFRNLDAFINRARWANSIDRFLGVRVCMSQQSECTMTQRGKPKAVTKVENATLLRSIWIDCKLKTKGRKHYRTPEEALCAIDAFGQKVGLPLPSAVVKSGHALQVYWISNTSLTKGEWLPYSCGLQMLLRREGVKFEGLMNAANLLPVPGTMTGDTPSRPVEIVHLGRRYDFSDKLSMLRDTAVEARAAARSGFRAPQTSAPETKNDSP